MIIRIAALLLLCIASLPLLAGERHAAGAEDCPSAIGADQGSGAQGAHRGDAEAASADKASSAPRGGDAGSSMRGPRMHNLLPGMFR